MNQFLSAFLQPGVQWMNRMIGTTTHQVPGLDGDLVIRRGFEAADAGGGWIDYEVVHPQTLEVEEKISYVELLSSDTLIGCGVFKPKSGFVH